VGRRGPPRLPESVRARRGTLQLCRTNPSAPDVPGGRPTPPDWLADDALQEWNRIVPLLDAAGLLKRLGRAALVAYCTAWAELADATRELAKGGTVIETENGPMLSPHVKRADKAREQLVKLGREFGLTPAAETGVKAGPTAADRAAADRKKRFFAS
jgi:P27 family predicted phage terminase small subunit